MRNAYLYDVVSDDGPIVPARFSGCMINSSSSKSAPVVNKPGLDALNANVGHADAVANLPFQSYGGELNAPQTQNEQIANSMAPGAFFAGMPAFDQAQNTATGLSSYQAPQASTAYARSANLGFAPQISPTSINRGDVRDVSPQSLAGTDLSPYMNPFQKGVIDTTLSDLERSRQIARTSDAQKATAANAFGGSRSGVMAGETNRAYDDNTARTLAALNSENFGQAQNAAVGDITRKQQADTGNAGADLSIAGTNANLGFGTKQYNSNNILDFLKTNAGNQQQINLTNAAAQNDTNRFNASNDITSAGVRAGGAGLLGDIGGAQQNSFLNALQALSQTGATQRGVNQSADDAAYQEFLRMLNDPFMKQQLRNQSLGLVPGTLGQNSSMSSFGFKLPMPGMG